MPILPKEIMSYKQAKKGNQLLTKIRIIRAVEKDGCRTKDVAESFRCHRNTVANLIGSFYKNLDDASRYRLLHCSLSKVELERLAAPMLDIPPIPLNHPKMVGIDGEYELMKMHAQKKVGVDRLLTHLHRIPAARLPKAFMVNGKPSLPTKGQLKGVYSRNGLRVSKARAKNGERRPLYDYRTLSCFESLHFDTKVITDAHALPAATYNYFIANYKKIPKYEWNIIDAKSRTRFIAYSFHLSAEYGLRFLILVLQHLRTYLLDPSQEISVWVDNGIEFAGGSTIKLKQINDILSPLNATLNAYQPHFDVRKNLIERSHRSDDEEFFVPLGPYLKTTDDFIHHAKEYTAYWNTKRPHSGIGMNNLTPKEKLNSCQLPFTDQILSFPTFIIEHHLPIIRSTTEPLLARAQLNKLEQQHFIKHQTYHLDQKVRTDAVLQYVFLDENAQKVLTEHRSYR